jgi:ribose transport system substrate-binding protein
MNIDAGIFGQCLVRRRLRSDPQQVYMGSETNEGSLYLIPVVTKALDMLEFLRLEDKPMNLETIVRRTNIAKSTTYRILKSLVHRGYVAQSVDLRYRYVGQHKKLRFGFVTQSSEMPFSDAVIRSLCETAKGMGIDLILLDNGSDAEAVRENAEALIRQSVDLMIEFQVDHSAAPMIAHTLQNAKVPLIAVDMPLPDATYFGIDNFRAGHEAGQILAEFARRRWNGRVDWILGVDLAVGGRLVQSRTTGAFEGIRAQLPSQLIESFVRIDGRGLRETSYRAVHTFLERHPSATHILIAAHNDASALGAIAAVRALGREKHVAIVGQDCVEEMLREMQRPGSCAIASISRKVEQYGPRLIEIGLALLRGEIVPPYNYVEHEAVRADQRRMQPRTDSSPGAMPLMQRPFTRPTDPQCGVVQPHRG